MWVSSANNLMKRITIPHVLVAAVIASVLCADARAQAAPEDDRQGAPVAEQGAPKAKAERGLPKVEIGGHYSQYRLFSNLDSFGPSFDNSYTLAAVGARLTYNITDHLAAEAEANFFTSRLPNGESLVTGGRPFQMQFGVKAGRRFRRFGLFARARPGFVSYAETLTPRLGESFIGIDGREQFLLDFTTERKTHFSLDVGAAVEFYGTRRLFARLDVGDTITRYGPHSGLDPDPDVVISQAPSRIEHNLQFSVGFGVRLGRLAGHDEEEIDAVTAVARAPAPSAPTRFEAGAHFTALTFSPILQFTLLPAIAPQREALTESGFGGRFTFNLTPYLAAEAETNLLPRKFALATGASGRVTQGQFGIKVGKRFRSFGLFAKARPGFVSFGSSLKLVGTRPITFFGRPEIEGVYATVRRTYFSADVGGVLELYPSRRWLLRFDGGDTVIRYGDRHLPNTFTRPFILTMPRETRHNLQFSAGFGLRF